MNLVGWPNAGSDGSTTVWVRTHTGGWATPALPSSWTSQYPIMPWVWATRTASGYGWVGGGVRRALPRDHAHLRPVAVAEHQLMIGGQRGQGRGGLPDVPPLDHRVRPFAPLEQRVSAEGHYDAHRSSERAGPRVAIISALIVCIRFSAWSNTTEAGEEKTSSVTSSASSPRLAKIRWPISVCSTRRRTGCTRSRR